MPLMQQPQQRGLAGLAVAEHQEVRVGWSKSRNTGASSFSSTPIGDRRSSGRCGRLGQLLGRQQVAAASAPAARAARSRRSVDRGDRSATPSARSLDRRSEPSIRGSAAEEVQLSGGEAAPGRARGHVRRGLAVDLGLHRVAEPQLEAGAAAGPSAPGASRPAGGGDHHVHAVGRGRAGRCPATAGSSCSNSWLEASASRRRPGTRRRTASSGSSPLARGGRGRWRSSRCPARGTVSSRRVTRPGHLGDHAAHPVRVQAPGDPADSAAGPAGSSSPPPPKSRQ